ncbi:MAG: reverse transcriptase/maturase family protein [Deltaproteobacteria bacterium]|jgi:retron-type reverse transcriptase|nr:reverse transcriptase/maturase family protein [Deltaproteobacteria bacterium]
MRTAKNLYQLIPDHENILLAFNRAALGRGTDPDVKLFKRDFDRNILKIRERLIHKNFTLGDYYFFEIRDPKRRKICAPSFSERVLHHACMNICEPFFERRQIFDSYACRKGKGNLKALRRAEDFARKNDWYLKLDISKYFDNIDHDICLGLLSKLFGDRDLLNLFDKIIATWETAPGKGIPIGSLISQYLANFYLSNFDHWVKEERKVKFYPRYMDDFVLFHKDKDYLVAELKQIEEYLNGVLKLKLKSNIQLNRTVKGLPFVGYRIYRSFTRLTTQSKARFSKKFRIYEKNYCLGVFSEKELSDRVRALTAFTEKGDCHGFRRYVFDRFGVLS